jgi:hypothetical protein
MRRSVLLLLPLLALWPIRADALSVRDLVELSRAGLGDDVLLALIEVDPSVFPIDAATLKAVKAAGVSDRVIVAMVRSSRPPAPPLETVAPPEPLAQPPEPQVVVIEHHDPPVIREVQVPYPVYIPVASHAGNRQHARSSGNPAVPVQTLYPLPMPPFYPAPTLQPQQSQGGQRADGRHTKPSEPVYWGFGGTLRPDAWKPK